MKLFQLILVLLLIVVVRMDGVCDEKLLLMELREDINDNGTLDCLRDIQPPHSLKETAQEKNYRISAQWNTDCAFEASNDWLELLRSNYGIDNLVDDSGDIVEQDFENQADMCEIVRAAIAAGKFSEVTTSLEKIPLKVLDLVDCAGDNKQSEICAVTGASVFQKDSWYILLDGLSLNHDNGVPSFKIKA